MFLDKELNTNLNIDDLVTESYENLLEFQNEMHELDMKMIKCEHACIMNEDTNTMMLAEEEYKSKLQAAGKAIWNKIVLTIQNFIIVINKAVTKLKLKFKVDDQFKTYAKNIFDKLAAGRTDFDIPHVNFKQEKFDVFDELKKPLKYVIGKPQKFTFALNDAILKLKEMLNSQDGFDSKKARSLINDLEDKYVSRNESGVKMDGDLAVSTLINIEFHQGWVKALEIAKNEAKKQASMSNMVKDTYKAADATIFQMCINKIIFMIQKSITSCFHVCYAVRSVMDGRIKTFKVNKFYPKRIEVGNKGTSIEKITKKD